MKKVKDNLPKSWWIIILLIALVLVYLFGVFYYRNHFIANTVVGSTSIAGRTVDSAVEKINQELENYEITLTENNESLGFIELGQLDAKITDESALREALASQNRYTWPIAMFSRKVIDSDTLIHTDDGLIAGLMEALKIQNEDRSSSTNAMIQKDDQQLVVIPETYGNQISLDSLKQTLAHQFMLDEPVLPLENAYVQPEIKNDSPELKAQMDYVEKMAQTKITMLFDNNEVTVPQELVASWVLLDNQGQPSVNVEGIESYLLEVNREYAQLFMPHNFQSTYQGMVSVNPGTLGWYINRFTEAENIATMIRETGDHQYEPHIEG